MISSVLIVGTGLMGTSLGLALTGAGVDVRLSDTDDTVMRWAADLGAGRPADATERKADVCVVATPPRAVATELTRCQRLGLGHVYTDVASAKSNLLQELTECGGDLATFVGGHPLAGREISGPGAARSDLFLGRPWVLTPTSSTEPRVLETARAMVSLVGGLPVVMTPEEHDGAVAVVSHVPQLLATLTAARLANASDSAVSLSGQGVRDVTRIAASDPVLWTEILLANAGPVTQVLRQVAGDLEGLIASLAGAAGELDQPGAHEAVEQGWAAATQPTGPGVIVRSLLEAGNRGRRRIPGKHGAPPTTYTAVPVVIPDRPGELARMLTACGEVDVNIEDMTIEHSPGQPVGLVSLWVEPAAAEVLAGALEDRGWTVHL